MPLPQGDDSPELVTEIPPAFTPYAPSTTEEPDTVQPSSASPAPSSNAPGFGGTSGADGQPEGEPSEEAANTGQQEQEHLEFDPRHREPFEGLLYLGRLEKTFWRWGHKFVIRTLTSEQLAEIGQIVKPYEETRAANAVYQSAVVAACVVTVDSKPLPGAITIDTSDELTTVKFPYVQSQWLPPVREEIYQECFRLELKVREVLKAMGEAHG